jgi:hypothetical protein
MGNHKLFSTVHSYGKCLTDRNPLFLYCFLNQVTNSPVSNLYYILFSLFILFSNYLNNLWTILN